MSQDLSKWFPMSQISSDVEMSMKIMQKSVKWKSGVAKMTPFLTPKITIFTGQEIWAKSHYFCRSRYLGLAGFDGFEKRGEKGGQTDHPKVTAISRMGSKWDLVHRMADVKSEFDEFLKRNEKTCFFAHGAFNVQNKMDYFDHFRYFSLVILW